MTEITHRTIESNGLRIHIAEAGAGPLVLLCHGFPESWYSWRHQLRALAEAGYRAVAPGVNLMVSVQEGPVNLYDGHFDMAMLPPHRVEQSAVIRRTLSKSSRVIRCAAARVPNSVCFGAASQPHSGLT